MKQRIIVALGGNAIQSKGESGTHEQSYSNVINTMKHLVPLINDPENEVVITHGNGPQVGSLLIQNALGSAQVPAMPMFVCGAESQGQIGLWIQQSLVNLLGRGKKQVATVITQVEVAVSDPAFKNSNKPVGPFYSEGESQKLSEETGFTFKEDAGRGFRRVVPSPEPIDIIEIQTIKDLVEKGTVVVACGGGGIPVISEDLILRGVDAVIDKDRAGALLAKELNADLFVILTAVEKVAINFGKPNQKDLDTLNLEEIEKYNSEKHFAEGSMGPKISAAYNFIKNRPGGKVLITSPDKLPQALKHETGTWISA